MKDTVYRIRNKETGGFLGTKFSKPGKTPRKFNRLSDARNVAHLNDLGDEWEIVEYQMVETRVLPVIQKGV